MDRAGIEIPALLPEEGAPRGISFSGGKEIPVLRTDGDREKFTGDRNAAVMLCRRDAPLDPDMPAKTQAAFSASCADKLCHFSIYHWLLEV
jgi:hypothetical protein